MQSQAATLVHDFGTVRPREVRTWRFTLHNPTDQAWTLKSIGTSCHCTVAALSAPVVAPQASETVDVELTLGSDLGDVRKSVTLSFEEANAPPVTLWVAAGVRNPISPSDTAIAFGELARGGTASYTLDLNNYSTANWARVEARAAHAWLTVTPPEMAPRIALPSAGGAEAHYAPRETWRATVSADTGKLDPGYHQGAVRFTASDGRACDVPVWVHLSPAVRFAPSKLVFGPAVAGECSTLDCRVIFSPRGAPDAAADVAVSSDDPAVKCALSKIDGRVWNLRCTAAHSARRAECRGTIRVSCAAPEAAAAELPFTIHTRAEESP